MAQVVSRYDEFQALDVRVAAISFGIAYWAQVWMAETDAPFPVWLDPDRASYDAYGLEASLWRAWGWRNLRYYATALLKGEKLHSHYGRNRGDTDQLGGNFIVDGRGVLRFAYPSRDPTDRPSIEDMLKALKKIKAT